MIKFFRKIRQDLLRDNIPYSNWRKGQKARMLNKDYSKKGSYYSVLKALYETRELTN